MSQQAKKAGDFYGLATDTANRIAQGAADMAVAMYALEKLTGAPYAKAGGDIGKIAQGAEKELKWLRYIQNGGSKWWMNAWRTAKQAGKFGLFELVTTPGSAQDRLKKAFVSTLYVATPITSSLAGGIA